MERQTAANVVPAKLYKSGNEQSISNIVIAFGVSINDGSDIIDF